MRIIAGISLVWHIMASFDVGGHDTWFSVDLRGFDLALQQPQQWLPMREEGKLSSARSSASHEDNFEVCYSQQS